MIIKVDGFYRTFNGCKAKITGQYGCSGQDYWSGYTLDKSGLTTRRNWFCDGSGYNSSGYSLMEEWRANNMIGKLKEYFDRHDDMIITVFILIVVDHYVFDGAAKDKLRQLFDKLLNKTAEKLELASE